MATSSIPPRRLELLRAAPLTYAAVGASASASPPAGYRVVREERALVRRDLDGAAEDLLTWRVHQRAGLHVAASGPRAVPGAVVDMRLGPGPLSIRIPCRVVSVVDEPDRRGFAYGTLPGHPESGEELFLLQRGDESGAASRHVREAGPMTPGRPTGQNDHRVATTARDRAPRAGGESS